MKLIIILNILVLNLYITNAAIKEPGWKHCVHPLHALPNQWNKIVSPGFPNGINTQIQCSWMISANPGYRIKLAFHTLNVTGSRKSCFTQFVEILDYKIGHSVGKFCGASRPGDYVSWGQRIRFDLQGDTSGAKTKGFDLRYKATREPGGFKSSWTFPLKPKSGKKGPGKSKSNKPKNKKKGSGGSAFVKPRKPAGASPKSAGGAPGRPLKKSTPVAPPPAGETPAENPVKNLIQKQPASPKPTRPAIRTPGPQRRIDFKQPAPPRQGPIIYGENSNRRGVDHGHSSVITIPEDEEEPLNIYIIVGVAAGGVVALTIIFILMKVCIFDKNRKRKQRRKEQEERAKSSNKDSPDSFYMSGMSGTVPEQYMTEQIVPQLQSYHHMQPLPMMPQTMSRHQYPNMMYPPPTHSSKSRTAPAMMVPPRGVKSSRSRARSSRSRVERKDEIRRSKSRSSMRNPRTRSSMRRSKSRSMQVVPNMDGWIMVDPRYQPSAVIKNPHPRDNSMESSDSSSSSGWASDSTDSYRPKPRRRDRRFNSLPRMRSQPPTYESATGRPYYIVEKLRDFDEGYDTGRRTNGTKSAASKKGRDKKRNSKSKDRRRKYSH